MALTQYGGKQLKVYNDFSGGFNSSCDARNLKDNELSAAVGVMCDRAGMIRRQGKLAAPTGITGTVAITIVKCYGLFAFGADYAFDGVIANPQTNAPTKYLALVNATNSEIYILPIGAGTTWTQVADLGATATGTVVYYYADGALRICDASFGAGNTVRWFGYIKQDHFGGDDSYDRWYEKDATIVAPTEGIIGEFIRGSCTNDANSTATNLRSTDVAAFTQAATPLAGGDYIAANYVDQKARIISAYVDPDDLTTDTLAPDTWQNDEYRIFPPPGAGFNAYIYSGGIGEWAADELEFASSFIYMGGQESLPFQMYGTFTPTVNEIVYLEIFATSPVDPRIIGGRIYYRIVNTDDSWVLLADISMESGARASLTSSYQAWNQATYNGAGAAISNNYYDTYVLHVSSPIDTYESINGYKQSQVGLTAKFKHASVTNRRVFVANVKTVNESGTEVVYGDRIMYTPVGKFDIFVPNNYVDVVPGDGDEFTALQGFADRLIAFKRQKMYIINVAQGEDTSWFLESEHDNLGVEKPAQTFRTDYGVIWINSSGCFIYDGEAIRNLIMKERDGQLQRVMTSADWEAIYTDDTIVGFDPKLKQIIVVWDVHLTVGLTYIYDMPSGSWTLGVGFAQDSSHKMTNFVTLDDELLVGRYSD